jgi:hypothetical protein
MIHILGGSFFPPMMGTGNRDNLQEEARNVKNKVRNIKNGRRMGQQRGDKNGELDQAFGMFG